MRLWERLCRFALTGIPAGACSPGSCPAGLRDGAVLRERGQALAGRALSIPPMFITRFDGREDVAQHLADGWRVIAAIAGAAELLQQVPGGRGELALPDAPALLLVDRHSFQGTQLIPGVLQLPLGHE